MTAVQDSDKSLFAWERFHQIGTSPVRILHKGPAVYFPERDIWDNTRAYFAFSGDSLLTAAVRPFATPFDTACSGAEKGRQDGGRVLAAVAGSVGLCYGVPKGLLGAGVSLVCGVGCVVPGIIVGSAATVRSMCSGLYSANRFFTRTENQTSMSS